MVNKVQTLRSSTRGQRPTGQAPGVLWVTYPDNAFGVIDAAGAAFDLLAVRFFSSLAAYVVGDHVLQAGNIYRCTTANGPGAFVAGNWSKVVTAADVTTTLAGYLPLAGGTMTGPIVLSADPAAPLQPATRQYADTKAPIASPTFTGVPAAPTAAPGTSTTQLASTGFVAAAIAPLAPLASPTLTGDPKAPTASPGDNDTSIATTAFVAAAVVAAAATPPGIIQIFAGAIASIPAGWFACNGQNINRAANPNLFNLFNTMTGGLAVWGIGDGSTTFGLPDLRGRVPAGIDDMGTGAAGRIHAGAWAGAMNVVTLGGIGGEDLHTMTGTESAPHAHSHNHGPQGGTSFVRAVAGGNLINNSAGTLWAVTGTTDTDNSAASGYLNGSHNTLQPTLLVNYIIRGG